MSTQSDRTICVVAAHPDDEVLLAGGTIARHAAAGDKVHIVILAAGADARGGPQVPYIGRLRDQAQKAARILGASSVDFHDWPDNRMDTVPLLDIVQKLEAFLQEKQCGVVYTHHANDLNIDHRIAHQAALTACRPLPGAIVTTILAGETNSSTEWEAAGPAPFFPTEFVDIGTTVSQKLAALECYAEEMRPWPHPRSIEGVRALARWRGIQSGHDAAEAFATIRRLHRLHAVTTRRKDA